MSFTPHRDVLPSGLRVVTIETPHLHTALLSVYVRTGSRHETPQNNGVSHFLEHLFFRGSDGWPDTVRMNAAVEEVGGNLNGVTTRDHGYYYTPLHPDHMAVGMNIIGDMLTRPRLTDMEVERQIILEEMLDEVDDKGRDIDIDNLSKRLLFSNHPLALKIAGTRESVSRLTHAQVLEHFARHYVAGNIVVTAAGRVRHSEVITLAERAFARLPEGPATTEEMPLHTPPGPRLHFVTHDESQTEFRLNFRIVPEHHEDFPALQILRRVLDDGLSSRLPFEIVEKRGLAYSLSASMDAFHDAGVFEIDAACAPEKSSLVVEEVLRVLGTLCTDLVSDEELTRAKRRHRMLLEFAQDSPGELAGWFGGTELFRKPESFNRRADMVDAQTAQHVREVARHYFARENLTVVAVGQRKGSQALQRVVQDAQALPTAASSTLTGRRAG
ncbi:M16 family metallopeptidase [Stigmatella aurantiaca]|uniref:Peptidase, M16 (Pitrilysin) family n=1 Tax=Stigmatella aurantiaca (strain DW4/3-1) TaxID=378806 RepID=Q08UK4_STIAD|nr:pitrilysin family protein [Stigmatella aurantiaca]ADO73591.1 Peptidase, M16 (Pitrilysin) family [Stigmatella aurantiaca DW4/3-1]EAU64160.1 peptidase, M16 family [Stigmatella aurantiaca DW4/3-1]